MQGTALARTGALCGALLLAGTCTVPLETLPAAIAAPAPARPIDLGPELSAFYQSRDFRPLWVEARQLRPEAIRLAAILPPSPELSNAIAAAQSGGPEALTRADLLLSRAYVAAIAERRRAPRQAAMRYIDRGLAPAAPAPTALLADVGATPDLANHLGSSLRRNPAYDGLIRGLARYRARWSRLPRTVIPGAPGPAQQRALRRRLGLTPNANVNPALREFQQVHALPDTGRIDSATIAALNRDPAFYERLIEANIDRARAIPARPGERMIVVDTASARLWMVEDGRVVDAMRVIVGKEAMATPAMAGMIRYAMLNPYWNLPPDLIRVRARNVLRQGPRALAREHLQILSDWSPSARVLRPNQVDWRAVAAGRRYVNLRQTPGAHNVMGRIKFMLPNDLGIYLHDTPDRALFAQSDRRISSGCIRLEDANRLARWLYNGRPPRPIGAPEQRVNLPQPVPVYITYLTAIPTVDGVRFQRDVYGRDRAQAGVSAASRRPRQTRRA